jgi:hypothetical protein
MAKPHATPAPRVRAAQPPPDASDRGARAINQHSFARTIEIHRAHQAALAHARASTSPSNHPER